MKLKTTSIIFIVLFVATACSTYKSVYQDAPLTIDGSSSDWTTTLDSKNSANMSYGISNDTSNLYIRIHTSNQNIQKKIAIAGLTIWIDTTGKSKEYIGITCPLKKMPPKMDRNSMQEPKWNTNQFLEAEFIGFGENDEIYFITENPFGIEISMNQDEFKSLYYELKIPFSSIKLDYDTYLQKPISIGIETGSINMPGLNHMQSGSKPAGAMGGRPGGMQGGPPGNSKGNPEMQGQRPGMESMDNLNNPTKFWVKNIQIATK